MPMSAARRAAAAKMPPLPPLPGSFAADYFALMLLLPMIFSRAALRRAIAMPLPLMLPLRAAADTPGQRCAADTLLPAGDAADAAATPAYA